MEEDVFPPCLEEIELNILISQDCEIHCANCIMVNMVATWQHCSLQKVCFVAEDTILPLGNEDIKWLEDFSVDSLAA